jgi:hypothetical protein
MTIPMHTHTWAAGGIRVHLQGSKLGAPTQLQEKLQGRQNNPKQCYNFHLIFDKELRYKEETKTTMF